MNKVLIKKPVTPENGLHEKNLKQVLNWERKDTRIVKKYAGMLKGALKKSPVAYQRESRKELERSKK
jgi:hypothetical protein